MHDETARLIQDGTIDLDLLQSLSRKPEPFAPGVALFWDDPYISQQMLAAHLDPLSDAASRKPETIDRIVEWLIAALDLRRGNTVLDLGCGPGLYCERFAARGLSVDGMDYSRRSIAYAEARAAEQGLSIHYTLGNYLETPLPRDRDAILLIFGDFCVLRPDHRDLLLSRVREALKEGGTFVFDVSTRHLRRWAGVQNGWQVVETGFWRPVPHLVLTQGFDYPEESIYLDQYIVVTAGGEVAVYRNWFQDYSLEAITAVLSSQGFAVRAAWSDLAGAPYEAEADWIGIVAAPC